MPIATARLRSSAVFPQSTPSPEGATPPRASRISLGIRRKHPEVKLRAIPPPAGSSQFHERPFFITISKSYPHESDLGPKRPHSAQWALLNLLNYYLESHPAIRSLWPARIFPLSQPFWLYTLKRRKVGGVTHHCCAQYPLFCMSGRRGVIRGRNRSAEANKGRLSQGSAKPLPAADDYPLPIGVQEINISIKLPPDWATARYRGDLLSDVAKLPDPPIFPPPQRLATPAPC